VAEEDIALKILAHYRETALGGKSASVRLRKGRYFRFLLQPFKDNGGPHSVHQSDKGEQEQDYKRGQTLQA
jgi:hypothetical protein